LWRENESITMGHVWMGKAAYQAAFLVQRIIYSGNLLKTHEICDCIFLVMQEMIKMTENMI
jgi:hypothetical protein